MCTRTRKKLHPNPQSLLLRKRHRSLSCVSRYQLVVTTLAQGAFLHGYPGRFSLLKAQPSRTCLLRLLTLENVLVHCGTGHVSRLPRGWWLSRDGGREGVGAAVVLPMLLRSGSQRPAGGWDAPANVTYLMLEEDTLRRMPAVLSDEKLLAGVRPGFRPYAGDGGMTDVNGAGVTLSCVRVETPCIARYSVSRTHDRAKPGLLTAIT